MRSRARGLISFGIITCAMLIFSKISAMADYVPPPDTAAEGGKFKSLTMSDAELESVERRNRILDLSGVEAASTSDLRQLANNPLPRTYQLAFINAHNELLSKIDNCSNLIAKTYVTSMAETADKTAAYCDYNGKCRYNQGLTAPSLGINVAIFPDDKPIVIADVMNVWQKEEEYFDRTTMRCESYDKCGNYLRMVRWDATAIGCSVRFCETYNRKPLSDQTNVYTVVCVYGPGSLPHDDGLAVACSTGQRCAQCPPGFHCCDPKYHLCTGTVRQSGCGMHEWIPTSGSVGYLKCCGIIGRYTEIMKMPGRRFAKRIDVDVISIEDYCGDEMEMECNMLDRSTCQCLEYAEAIRSYYEKSAGVSNLHQRARGRQSLIASATSLVLLPLVNDVGRRFRH